MKTLVIGLGNPILGDDGVGWRVAEEVSKHLDGRPDVEVDTFSLGGLSLMERMTGYDCVVMIDAIYTGQKKIGTVSRFNLNDLSDLSAGHSASAHDTSLRNALKVGRSMDIPLPMDEAITVIAIEANNVYDFSEQLSPAVATAVPKALTAVLNVVQK